MQKKANLTRLKHIWKKPHRGYTSFKGSTKWKVLLRRLWQFTKRNTIN